jgi:3,4-dihydroxy 2-butanone 4-phosphate synthase/GTP cyclohydrolase II
MPPDDCDRLDLPPMSRGRTEGRCSAQRVSVDLIGTGTGISATARARTIAALSGHRSRPDEFSRPGHVIPVVTAEDGVLAQAGPPEAAVDLVRLAGLRPAAGMSEIVSGAFPGQVAGTSETADFAQCHRLEIVALSDVVAYRKATEPQVVRMAASNLPTVHGEFRAVGYRGVFDQDEHVALVAGDIGAGSAVPLYLHEECLAGDVLGSSACRCAADLAAAAGEIGATGHGVIVYSRSLGRTQACGIFGDPRSGTVSPSGAPAVLRDLGVRSAWLVASGNESQRRRLEQAGVQVCAAPASLGAAS